MQLSEPHALFHDKTRVQKKRVSTCWIGMKNKNAFDSVYLGPTSQKKRGKTFLLSIHSSHRSLPPVLSWFKKSYGRSMLSWLSPSVFRLPAWFGRHGRKWTRPFEKVKLASFLCSHQSSTLSSGSAQACSYPTLDPLWYRWRAGRALWFDRLIPGVSQTGGCLHRFVAGGCIGCDRGELLITNDWMVASEKKDRLTLNTVPKRIPFSESSGGWQKKNSSECMASSSKTFE